MIAVHGSRRYLSAGLFYLSVLLLAVPFLLPFLWVLTTSFKPAGMVYEAASQWLYWPATLENFRQAWGLLDFPRFILNSLLVTGLTVLGTLFSSSLVGYAFATLPARGKRALFSVSLATIMVPAPVTLIPLFVFFSKLGWVNTYLPLVVPHFFGSALFIFLFRQFFRGLPRELLEAAELDGCNPWQAYWRMALPLARPALAAVAVFTFVNSWNDFLGPLVYLSSNSQYTMSLGLSLFQEVYYVQIHYLMPMSLVALIPIVALFFAAQRHLARGIITTSYRS